MERPTRAGSSAVARRGRSERGFTLAAVIVIMTIMMIFVAYTVPRQWSTLTRREREQETIFAMKQYAMSISDFKLKNNTFPTSPQQLKDARQPRMIRGVKGELIDALTGEVDWLVIPQSAASILPQHNPPGAGQVPPGVTLPQPVPQPSPNPTPSVPDANGKTPAPPGLPGIPIKDYAGGPFIGVRPAAHGKSLITLFGAGTYETWVYTTVDYEQERTLRLNAAGTTYR